MYCVCRKKGISAALQYLFSMIFQETVYLDNECNNNANNDVSYLGVPRVRALKSICCVFNLFSAPLIQHNISLMRRRTFMS